MNANTSVFKFFFLSLIFIMSGLVSYAQCEPMSPEQCPDPENNGQICPEVMPNAYLGELYSEVATVRSPLQDSSGIQLHHITIDEIGNLPPGITWVSNAANNELMAGEYYCILMEGNPVAADTFYLRIVIDIYISILGQIVHASTVVDSTSLLMIVYEEHGLDEQTNEITFIETYPNPFREWANICFNAENAGTGKLEIFSLQGIKVDEQKINILQGENTLIYNADHLPIGGYCFIIRNKKALVSSLVVKAK